VRIFGREITISRVPATPVSEEKALAPVGAQAVHPSGASSAISTLAHWWPVIREPFTGAWQRNLEQRADLIAAFHAIYSCVTLIASDISKMRLRLMEFDPDARVWMEVESPSFSPVLRKPNRYQTRIKFIEQWVVSKLLHGNTYVLKERDGRGVVIAMYVLDPTRTTPLVAPDGSIYYQLSRDNLAGITDATVYVPASEIIHDVMIPLYHPLCGVSPLTACGMAASQGLAIQHQSRRFFENGSKPGGILTAPGHIPPEVADRIKSKWEENYSGENVGRVAVLGDGLTYVSMSVNAHDAQLVEQLKLSAEICCSAFHVPGYKVGVGPMPQYNNIENLDQQYYSQCLQGLIENIEALLDEGLGLTATNRPLGSEFDIEDLLRMDTATKAKAITELTGAGLMKIDEGRRKFDLPPIPGGNDAYMQQQNYSLSALARRDQSPNPFAPGAPAAPATPPAQTTPGGKHLLRLAIASRLAMRSLSYARA